MKQFIMEKTVQIINENLENRDRIDSFGQLAKVQDKVDKGTFRDYLDKLTERSIVGARQINPNIKQVITRRK